MNHKHSQRIGNKTCSGRTRIGVQANKKTTRLKHRGAQAVRAGQTSIEVVAATAVMVPCVGIILFIGLKVCKQVYMTTNNAVCWPFM